MAKDKMCQLVEPFGYYLFLLIRMDDTAYTFVFLPQGPGNMQTDHRRSP